MTVIDDLLLRVEDKALRERLQHEFDRLNKQKKFGLVFEEHLPECTPLYEIPIKKGSLVAVKGKDIKNIYSVLSIDGDTVKCVNRDTKEITEFSIDVLVSVAQFGEPIYPQLIKMDSVQNAPDSDLWHTLIQADNYHALQLLEYLYAGKVDCIYIDPPYNTGAKDWKYNNDYVDSTDSYRHSKWLSMMQKRLRIAKRLLNPEDSVLIVTIDEKEYLHLACLLEEMYADARIQMVTIVTNPFGQERIQSLARVEEYAFFCFIGNAAPASLPDDMLNIRGDGNEDKILGEATQVATPSEKVRWERLLRGGADALRKNNPGLFYPVYINKKERRIQAVGEPIPPDQDRNEIVAPIDCVAVWPIKTNGIEGRWRCSPDYLRDLIVKGYARIGEYDKVNDRWTLLYLSKATMERINDGEIEVLSRSEDGSVVLGKAPARRQLFSVKTVWNRTLHRAGEWGTRFIRTLLPGRIFPYPKSLYAVKDTLKVIVANKPNAIIVDFFAGSGTTLHAVNLLNAEDGGNRRCIMVTNNEVSADEAKLLTAQGLHPGDVEWEKLGVAQYVTWPRMVCSIEGHDVNGNPLKGNYIGSDIPMAQGFKSNCAFFKLGFLDKNAVALGKQFKELLPILWMKAGCFGACPELIDSDIPDMMILPENKFAVLNKESAYLKFEEEVNAHSEIETIYIITDSESGYREIIKHLKAKNKYQLYRDYLDNFRINARRDLR